MCYIRSDRTFAVQYIALKFDIKETRIYYLCLCIHYPCDLQYLCNRHLKSMLQCCLLRYLHLISGLLYDYILSQLYINALDT